MSNYLEVVDRIFNLLTENKSIDKIKGIISTTEITKFGGEIEKRKVEQVYAEILNCSANKGSITFIYQQ